MKKHFSRVLAMVLVLVTLVATFAVPASAAGSYPMSCSIYYKDESGKQVATTKTFSMNAADTTAQQTKYYSPTVLDGNIHIPTYDSSHGRSTFLLGFDLTDVSSLSPLRVLDHRLRIPFEEGEKLCQTIGL